MKVVAWNAGGERRYGALDDGRIQILEGDWGGFRATGAFVGSHDVTLEAPLDPRSIVCVGLNYRLHAVESGLPVPDQPALFTKLVSSVLAPGGRIIKPDATEKLDYEVELGVVIGRETRGVRVEDALAHVAGYVTVNDVSARDLQKGDGFGWVRGKSADTFCPIGPFVLTADDVPDPQALRLTTTVNDEIRQDSTTADMIFSVAEVISFISQVVTLHPGDLIATGTPSGVADGMTPPRYLQPGDRVAVEIERLGRLENVVVAEESSRG
ncbi:fumarylacetoacetate hydrolase family protein [Microbacterium sulfonylureivorans]|uniref:fumarylacetoacetate hydrolase family protein n=1 Tax=Microbacterium sulfonylureivorans TaxID=2486854 RepID=UPI000FD97061|nr:fumarylacetoacetate hydrolase family protein [Microbacterium sulfonylureivorans]